MNRTFAKTIAILITAVTFACLTQRGAMAADHMTVHEWGTFTSVQNEDGEALPGINIDDEPVPSFVYNLEPYLLGKPVLSSRYWHYRQKAVPRSHPHVTMRLETPVLYFYPPVGQQSPIEVDVHVDFRGGWLTEFYPHAEADAPGLLERNFDFGALTPETVGSLTWKGVQVGTDGRGPETDEEVWLAPRRVQAVPISLPNGESERYLFYRGVANLSPPLRVTRDAKSPSLLVYGNFDGVVDRESRTTISQLWLVDVIEDGRTAFRTSGPVEATFDNRQLLATIDHRFSDADYASDNLDKLRLAMRAQLVAEGLYSDEAVALLTTWERAYFRSPGTRLFFVVPRVWTDHFLPLSLSIDADIERVMMGRIELVTPRQHKLLERLANTKLSDPKWIWTLPESELEKLLAGRSIDDLSIDPPEDFAAYLSLGRFRNAILIDEERRRPSPGLTRFINTYGLHEFRWQQQVQTAMRE